MQHIMESKTINVFGIALCTDEAKYIDEDSHYIHIPKSLFVKYINNINLNQTCFELSNPTNLNGPKIYLKKIEPSMNEFETNILLPDWVCKKLGVQMCGEQINIVPILKPNQVSRCKIRGSNSSYVKMDIKKLLEDKLNEFKCLNLGTNFTIEGIKFTIVELIGKANTNIEYGLTTNELEIDFDVPDDIKFLERRKTLTEKITKKIEAKINSNTEFKNKFNAKKTGIFKFNEYVEKQKTELIQFNPNIDWDEIHKDLLSELEKEYLTNPTEFEENKKILKELVDNGKITQNDIIEKNKKLDPNNKSEPNDKTDEKQVKKNVFVDTTGYKLDDSNKPSVITKEEIKRARLEKFTQK